MKSSLFLLNDRRLYFLLLYAVLTSVTIYFHECWRDEWQAILISIHSQSIPELFSLLKLEQHPPLWYLLIKAVWFIYPHLAAVKVLHIFIALGAAYILLYKIEYPFYYRVAFLFSYFLVYEYTIICRNYGLVVLFGLMAVAQLQKDKKNYFILFTAFSGMAFTHVNGLLLSIAFCFYFIVISKGNYRNLSFILFLLGYLFIIGSICIMLHPHEHHHVITTKISLFRLFRFFLAIPGYIWNVFVPLPEIKIAFWNSNFIDGIIKCLYKLTNWNFLNDKDETIKFTSYLAKFLLVIPLLYFLLKPLLKTYKIIISLFIFWLPLMLLQGFVYPGFMRHWGFYFISYVFFVKYFLAANIAAGLMACVMEIVYPFTSAKNAVENLGSLPQTTPIIVDECFLISPISGYLMKPVYFSTLKTPYLYTNLAQAYIIAADTASPAPATVFYSFLKEMKESGEKECVFILYFENKLNREFLLDPPKGNFTLTTKEFYGSISEEDFITLTLKRTD